ncbi:MAG: DUF1549 domain-containing protein, partial [Planctomycetales bacterium]|nr:DUF1549 domain-containing protein [Planctomycetales bacterium]
MSLPNCFSRIASLRSIGNASAVLIFGLLLASVTGITPVARATEADRANDVVEFNRDVRPILADKCFHCHGPDSATREAGLRLDREESAKQARDGGAAIVAGKPDDSELVRRIRATSDEQMPPADSGRILSAAERRTLERWISAGAAWERHWSFVPPRRPKLPSTKRTDWIRNPIDAYVLATLERQGLGPSPPADRMRLLRRVTFDLTGLPPTMEEMDRFLADSSPLAYERAVDRLLASPAWGEHWALEWLEAARYADTDGYQNDGPRDMWRWRDWVIEAYDRDLPFDQFTIEQLAGDLLPGATMSQRLATGFNRNHRYNSEAGLVQEEFLLENAVDRVDTTMAVWQGLTFGCARCHNHKYDPLTQQDYYGVIDLFNDVSESGRAVKFGNSEPVMLAPTTGQAEQWAQLEQRREN